MEIDVNEVLTAYKNRLSNVTHENVLLSAQGAALENKISELEERLAQLESADADASPDKPFNKLED